MKLRLIPRDEKFFDLLDVDGANLLSAATALREMVESYDHLDERVDRIRELEHAGDVIGDELDERLDRAFVTPFDREDIHELGARLDDVVDGIQEIAETMVIYGVERPTPEARRLSAILADQATRLADVLHRLESFKGLDQPLREIHELENEADAISREALASLFRGSLDVLDVLKWRDVYNALEETIDAAEDSGEVIERMIHKRT